MNLEPQERKALVLVGAGSAVFTRGLLADLISAPDLGPWDLRLVDTNPEALRVTVALAEKMVAARGEGERIRVRGTTDRAEVLPGAHVVIRLQGQAHRHQGHRENAGSDDHPRGQRSQRRQPHPGDGAAHQRG